MSRSVTTAADTTVPKFAANAHIRDSLNRILRDEYDDFWVVDENGLYFGVARQRDILNPPRLKIILVDHNEPSQAIAALEGRDYAIPDDVKSVAEPALAHRLLGWFAVCRGERGAAPRRCEPGNEDASILKGYLEK